MTAINKLLAIAEAEVGYLEKATNASLDDKTANAGDGNYTKYMRDLDALGVYNTEKQGYPWCDGWADWCYITAFGLVTAMAMTGQTMGGLGAGCTFSARYYSNMGRFYADPQVGDQMFFTADGGATSYHTGIVCAVDGTRVYTIEGNTSSEAGVVDNGGAVAKKSYALTDPKIYGYGRPDWSMVADEEDVDMTVDTAREIIKAKAGLADSTIDWMYHYRYGDELLIKLATAMGGEI